MNKLEHLDSGANEERTAFLQEVFAAALHAAHGSDRLNEQQVGQLMAGLVRSKLLSAEDSYRLQDKMLDKSLLDRAIEARVDVRLRHKGIITLKALKDLQDRISRLESQAA